MAAVVPGAKLPQQQSGCAPALKLGGVVHRTADRLLPLLPVPPSSVCRRSAEPLVRALLASSACPCMPLDARAADCCHSSAALPSWSHAPCTSLEDYLFMLQPA
jgi:hypothetical protein